MVSFLTGLLVILGIGVAITGGLFMAGLFMVFGFILIFVLKFLLLLFCIVFFIWLIGRLVRAVFFAGKKNFA